MLVFQGGTLAVLLNEQDVFLINGGKSGLLASPKSPSNKVSEICHKMSPVKFQEVTNGLCVVMTEKKSTMDWEWMGNMGNNRVRLGFEFVFLRGEKLSRALQKWVSIFSCQHSSGAHGWE